MAKEPDFLPSTEALQTNENRKFTEDPDLGAAVKVIAKIFGGELTILAPYDTENRTFDVTATETAIPVIARTIAIAIYNTSSQETIYLGKTGVIAGNGIGSVSGWDIGPKENQNESITPTSALFLIASAGKTVRVKVRYYIKSP